MFPPIPQLVLSATVVNKRHREYPPFISYSLTGSASRTLAANSSNMLGRSVRSGAQFPFIRADRDPHM